MVDGDLTGYVGLVGGGHGYGPEPFPKQDSWLLGMRAHVFQGGRWDAEEAQLRLPTRQPNSQRVLFLSLELGFSPASRSLSLS